MDEHNPYLASQTVTDYDPPVEDEPEALPIGGWLYLPLIGLFVTPARMGWILLTLHLPMFRNGTWEKLTTPGGKLYDPLWATTLWYEIAGNTIGIVLAVTTLVFFLKKSKTAPKLMISLLLYSLALVAGDELFAHALARFFQSRTPHGYTELIRSAVASAIWVPYFMMSQRVRDTFVRRWPRRPASMD